jgi:hypothetical protein
MRRLFTIFAVLLVCSQASLWAQDVPKAELFAGFSVLSVGGEGDRNTAAGWQASVAGNFTDRLGLVGDFGGHYKDGGRNHQFLFGPRVSARRERVTPFAHALFGGMRFSGGGGSETNFAMGFGGGIDYNVRDRVAIRVVQFDWLPTRFDAGSAGSEWETNIIRFGFGIVFKGSPR